MNKNAINDKVDDITDDARSLIAATAQATDEKVVEARNRLDSALDAAKQAYATVQKKAVAGAKTTDEAIRDKPYYAMGVAFGLGALIGFLVSRRSRD